MATKTAHPPLTTAFRALSDPTRMRILNLLRGGELCVCDLVDVLDVPQPTASRHLAYLRKAGLVLARKQGLWHFYRLTPTSTLFHEKLMECVEAAAEMTPQLAADVKQLQRGQRAGCCE